MCNFPAKEICLLLLMCSLWGLSLVLHSFWCCGKSRGSPMFSVAPRHPKCTITFPLSGPSQAKQKSVPWAIFKKARTLNMHSIFIFPSKGEVVCWEFSPNHTALCWEGDGVWQVSAMDLLTCSNASVFGLALIRGC